MYFYLCSYCLEFDSSQIPALLTNPFGFLYCHSFIGLVYWSMFGVFSHIRIARMKMFVLVSVYYIFNKFISVPVILQWALWPWTVPSVSYFGIIKVCIYWNMMLQCSSILFLPKDLLSCDCCHVASTFGNSHSSKYEFVFHL